MIVVHLDDAGEKRDAVATLAGWIGTENSWPDFEEEGWKYLRARGVEYVRGVELHQRHGQFKGWSREDVRAFAEGLFDILAKYVEVGMAFSVQKDVFDAKRLMLKSEGAATTFCFKGLITRIMDQRVIQPFLLHPEFNLSFVIESGNKHNHAIELEFERVRELDPQKFGTLILEDKKKRVGLMVADFAAYFSRRLLVAGGHPRHEEELKFFVDIIRRVGPFDGFLANNFYGPEDALPG